MAVNLELENEELATLFFYIQLNEKLQDDPVLEKLVEKMEAQIFSRFSIDEIEKYKNKASGDAALGDS